MDLERPPDDASQFWPFVRSMIHLDVATSTNDLAKQLALEGRDDLPLAIWADRQTQGRGQADRAWWSDAGSLTFSLLLNPRHHGLRIDHEPRLALAMAVAIAREFHESCGLRAEIRWPNDVELGGRKLGGILPERVETSEGTRLIVGIGLNVHTRLDEAPEDVRRVSVALGDVMSTTPDIPILLRGLLESIGARLAALNRDDRALAEEWAVRDSLRNQTVLIDLGPRRLTGVGRGIDAEGALLVETEGEIVRLFGGRVLRS